MSTPIFHKVVPVIEVRKEPSPEPLPAPKVLVIDDCEQLRGVLSEVLSTQGFEVIATESADEALEVLHSDTPDVILCDIMMPGTDGIKFNSVLRERSEWCQIPFIFLTALSDPDDVRVGKTLGCDEYVTKPFDPLDLGAVIRGKVKLARERKKGKAEEIEKYRRRIVHTLSHEFRTPLVAINTGAELLLDQKNSLKDEQVKKLLTSIQRGGVRLQRLVEDFMVLQQIESGSAAAAAERLRRTCSMVGIATGAIELFVDNTVDPELCITLNVEGEDPRRAPLISVYESQVSSAIGRLLSNAYKFGGATKQITLTVCTTEEEVSAIIRDRGPGLAPEVAARACEMFSQIDREKLEQQGCGLGLTIASCFTKLNNGSLEFKKPEDGVGLEVVVKFPRVSA